MFTDYDYIKNHYRLIAVNLSRQKELDAYRKTIKQIQFVETRLTFPQGSVTVLKKMANYEEARVKLTYTQLTKLKSAAKSKTGTTLRKAKKNVQDEKSPYELLLTRQKTKIGHAFANNMLADIKLNKEQFLN